MGFGGVVSSAVSGSATSSGSPSAPALGTSGETEPTTTSPSQNPGAPTVTIRRLAPRAAALAGVVALVLLASASGAGAAPAHIDPDPTTAVAGATTTISFKVEHGCDGSPTTDLAIKTPAGSKGAIAVEKQGWSTSVADGVVTFT